jgi:5'-methylthioadenosine phosphorylase
VIGMTNMPEAKLAREAELNYATVAMVTDFDCWHPDHDHVTVEAVVRVLLDNAEKARALVQSVVPEIGKQREACPAGCDHALDNAIITASHMHDSQLAAKLDAVAGRVLLPVTGAAE